MAARAGYDQPLMHGLCTYGMVCKSIVDLMLDGDPAALRQYRARFAGPVFPGDTLEISLWREPGRILASARTRERAGTALLAAALLS